MRRCIAGLALLAALPPGRAGANDPGGRPNVVLIIADDLGYGELGDPGPPARVPTPHLDALAASGARFTAGYVTASYCSPSRAGLLTGRYQNRFGYDTNPVGARNEDPAVGLPPAEVTLAEVLRDAGYATALVGKWHLGGTAAYHPMRHGFDTFFGFRHEGHSYVPRRVEEGPEGRMGSNFANPVAERADDVVTWLRRRALPGGGEGVWTSPDGLLYLSTHMGHHEPPYDADNPIVRDGQPVAEPEYLTDAFTREATRFIERHGDRPFFLCLSYNAVHSPMQARGPDVERFSSIEDPQRRIFAGMLRRLDEGVGRVLATLDRMDMRENTLILFVSDNGGPTRELTSSNHPLRGGKGDLYEGGIRVPFLVSWPGTIPGGAVEDRPALATDFFATAASAARVDVPGGRPIDGVDLLPFLAGRETGRPHETLYWRMGPRAALRSGDWKIVRDPRAPSGDTWQLYDLSADPAERRDLAGEHPETVGELSGLWERLESEMHRSTDVR